MPDETSTQNPLSIADFFSHLAMVEAYAQAHHGGHYTIMRFTTHVKGCWGSVNDLSGADRDFVETLPFYHTLPEIIASMAYWPEHHNLYVKEKP